MVDSFNPEHINEIMEAFTKLIDKLETTRKELRDAGAFVSCLSAQDVHDKKATQLVGEMSMISAKMGTIQTNFNQKLIAMDEKAWEHVLNTPEISELAFVLQEKRDRAKDK